LPNPAPLSSPPVDVDKVDETPAVERDDCAQERLFEDVTEVEEHDDDSTSPRRSPKPNPRHSPDNYDLKCVSGKPRTKSWEPIKMIHFALEGELARTEEREGEPDIRFEEDRSRPSKTFRGRYRGSSTQWRFNQTQEITNTKPQVQPWWQWLCGEQVEDKEQEEHQKVKTLIKMIPFALEGEERA
jgi:hypothetical protein